jgi:hypothetical protein
VRGFEGETVYDSEPEIDPRANRQAGGGGAGGQGNGGVEGGKVPWHAGTAEFNEAKTRRRDS